MPISHLLLAIFVMLIWGLNFIFVKLSLDEISPILLCASRFFLVFFPAIFFIKPPATSVRFIVWYGLLTFALQFSLIFIGMRIGMPPGLASILAQLQIFFSVFLAALFLKEIPTKSQLWGALISFSGIGIVGLHLDATATLPGFILIICATIAWGAGNLIAKKMGRVNMIALVVWGSFVAFFPLLLLSIVIEGPQTMAANLLHLTPLGMGSLLFIAYASTWIGYGTWNWLLSRYNVGTVVPFMLLVPVFGMLSSILFLHESFQFWKLVAGLLVITGLLISLVGDRLIGRKNSEVTNEVMD